MRGLFVALVIGCVWLGCPVSAGAHRLDEYLQATRLSIAVDCVGLELDMTAGVNVAPQVVASIDTDRDGQISSAEGDLYARRVLGAIELSVDGRTASLTAIDSRFPQVRDISDGVGTIRLRAMADVPPAPSGRRQLVFVNQHRSDLSVYLVNALVPEDARVRIAGQRRDPAQHRLTVEYDVSIPSRSSRTSWLLGGLATVVLLAVTRRSRRRFNTARKNLPQP